VEQEARRVLKGLGFKEAQVDQPFESLSGGWRMRCMLAGVLTQIADIMILDEPTNFLDLLGVIWLETYLKQLREESTKTVVLVSHDRAFLDAICEETAILKDQKLEYFRGNVSAYEADLKSKRLYWGRMKEAQDRHKSHMEATIRENIKLGKKTGDDNKLTMAKSRQKKMDERMGVQVNATGGRFKLNRDHAGWHDSLRAEIEVPPEERGVSMVIPDAPELRFPGSLISAEALSFRYRSKDAPILDSVDLVIHMGDRVGLLGLNGCGKTTLLGLLTGSLDSPQGKVSRHSRLRLGYYSQHSVEDLHKIGQSEAGLTALTLIRRETEGALDEAEARGLLGSLGLPGRTASDVPVAQLSGGQLVSNLSPFRGHLSRRVSPCLCAVVLMSTPGPSGACPNPMENTASSYPRRSHDTFRFPHSARTRCRTIKLQWSDTPSFPRSISRPHCG
jgi:ATPase subunit of ABC transporter with duplicated ATPase domains